MCETDEQTGAMFSYVPLEARVPADHPLRTIGRSPPARWRNSRRSLTRPMSDSVAPRCPRNSSCGRCCSRRSTRSTSERQLMEPLDYHLLFRWFVGLGMDDRV